MITKSSATALFTGAALALAGSAIAGTGSIATANAPRPEASFKMVRSTSAATADCLNGAKVNVKIFKVPGGQRMDITAKGLPKRTNYDLFITQAADAPFGVSWYQGDVSANSYGEAKASFVGIFSRETFTVTPGGLPHTQEHPEDAPASVTQAPVHQFHVGLWFASPRDAAKAGCATDVTPFEGNHRAGVQAFSTRNFTSRGPLAQVG